jgi:hypothetical protein
MRKLHRIIEGREPIRHIAARCIGSPADEIVTRSIAALGGEGQFSTH